MRALTVLLLTLSLGCASLKYPDGLGRAIDEGPDTFLEKAVLGPRGDGTYVVATSQVIESAGKTVTFSGRPTDLALSPDESLVAIKNMRDVSFLDRDSASIVQTLRMPKAGNSFNGIVWSQDGSTVWTTDAEDHLRGATRQADGTFKWTHAIPLAGPGGRGNSSPGGLLLDEDRGLAYVTLSRNNTVAVVNLESKTVLREIPVGIAPYTVLRQGTRAFVTNWGGRRPKDGEQTGPTSGSRVLIDPKTGIASSGTVSVIDLNTDEVMSEIEVGLHPSGMALSPYGRTLYIANANSDTVSVIDTTTLSVTKTIGVKPMNTLPFGSAPNALYVSRDRKRLYVANGGNNALAVIDLERGRVTGLIPTGWYPGAVIAPKDESTLIVANTKGVGGRYESADPNHRGNTRGSEGYAYNSHNHLGSISIIPMPDEAELVDHTYRAATNMRLPTMHQAMTTTRVPERFVPVPARPGERSVFKHVLYIIKENRTYDQVLGDMPQGNGDPALTQFGREVTPNHHALAEEFVLLDNFYCNGVLSADGHQWTNEGYVTDYLEKSFGGFSRSYPYDGDDALAYASSGFIWDYALAKGLSLRVYGEFVQASITPRNATWTDIYRQYLDGTNDITIKASTQLHTLEPYIHPTFIGFPGKVQDVYRAQMFIDELKEFEAKGELPNLMIMLLPNNHTVGTREGYPTPRAAVADNDLALGMVVEAISRSSFWPETVIFVVEDDPQAGLDHVDGRRTTAFCISPYTKRGRVESTHYNQNSMLRTMELILGLPPMSQLDLCANPMFECFTRTPDFAPYIARPNNIPLDQLNPTVVSLRGKQRRFAEISMKLPLDDIDMADEDTFNRILWAATKGYDTPYPKITHRREVLSSAWPTVDRGLSDD